MDPREFLYPPCEGGGPGILGQKISGLNILGPEIRKSDFWTCKSRGLVNQRTTLISNNGLVRQGYALALGAALYHVLFASVASVPLHSGTWMPRAVDSVACSVPTEVDLNATRTFRRFPAPNLVPWPVAITASGG